MEHSPENFCEVIFLNLCLRILLKLTIVYLKCIIKWSTFYFKDIWSAHLISNFKKKTNLLIIKNAPQNRNFIKNYTKMLFYNHEMNIQRTNI